MSKDIMLEYIDMLDAGLKVSKEMSMADISRTYRVHRLSSSEILNLESNNNTASDWSQVIFISQLSPSRATSPSKSTKTGTSLVSFTISRIRNCSFIGTTVIQLIPDKTIVSRSETTIEYNTGLYDSTFSSYCFIEANCFISRSILSRVYVCNSSIVIGCSSISCNPNSDFAINNIIEIGAEFKGRPVSVYPGMYFQSAISQGFKSSSHQQNKYNIDPTAKRLTYIGQSSEILNCSKIFDSFIGQNCLITDTIMNSCVIINTQDKPIKIMRSQINACIMHSGCSIPSSAIIDNVYMFENSSVSEFARLHNVILGPDSSIAGGECHHSLFGPFTGFHHQSLLIACLWPFGRGNVAYGAKIGSNHSGRLNDQECWMGEGVFTGLDVSIRYPFNSMSSPYSIISTGTLVHSQKIEYPFSLIMNNDLTKPTTKEPNPSLYNLIKPGWMLWGNAYYMERSIIKFSTRRKAKNHRTDFPIIRPSIISMVIHAMTRLEKEFLYAKKQLDSSTTTDDMIVLDKCMCSIKDAEKGIHAYRNLVSRYSLQVIADLIAKHKNARQSTLFKDELVDVVAFPVLLPTNYSELLLSSAMPQIMSSKYLVEDADLSYCNDTKLSEALITLDQLRLLTCEFGVSLNDNSMELFTPLGMLAVLEPSMASGYIAPSNTIIQVVVTLRVSDTIALLEKLLVLEKSNLIAVISCREKDNEKGCEVIPDYASTNDYMRTGRDSVIESAESRVKDLQHAINAFKGSESLHFLASFNNIEI